MKILYHIRIGYKTSIAGDSIQMIKTRHYLEKLGIKIDVSTSRSEKLDKYDLVHLFNVTKISHVYDFYKNAAMQRKKIVTTPIFIDMREYYSKKQSYQLAGWRTGNLLRREVLEGSDLILPNSRMEAQWIREILYVNTPYHVVPNGIDEALCEANGDKFIKKYGISDFILCVGRISPLKNQAGLIQALKGLPFPLVLIGPINHRGYAKKCFEEATGNIRYIPWLCQEELACAYKAARVHVQPSWFETTGLASLEAAAAGTRVVITDRGATKEYFQDMAWYCQPHDPGSIKNAILDAYNSQPSDKLQKHVLKNFTWRKVAEKTLQAYQRILHQKK